MAGSDLKTYTQLYLDNAKQEIETLKLLVNENKDIVLLHRLSHSLKGQSYFMNFNKIGHMAKELEVFFKSLLDNKQVIALNDNAKVVTALNEIERLLSTIKI